MTRESNNRAIYTTLSMQQEVLESIENAIGNNSMISYDFEEVVKDHFIKDLESLEEFRINNLICLNLINTLKREFEYYANCINTQIIELEKGKKE